MNDSDLAPFSRAAFEHATGDELDALCERLAAALVRIRRRGRSEGDAIDGLRGAGHDLWSFDEEHCVWCGNWAAPVPGGELIIEGLGERWCKVSWRVETTDPTTAVHSATFDAKHARLRVETPPPAGNPASAYLFAAGATRVGTSRGNRIGSDRFAAHSGFAAVAAGGGSFSGGGLAAEIATDVVISRYRRTAPSSCYPSSMAHVHGASPPSSEGSLRDDVWRTLKQAVVAAEDAIVAASQLDDTYRGMASSLTVGFVCQGRLFFAHLGQSRMFHVHAGRVEQLTQDHVVAGHPGVVTHGLGCGVTDGLQTGMRLVEPGDQIVMATYGLHAHLSPEAILRAFEGCDTARLQECAEALLRRAPPSGEDATCVVGLIA